MLFKKTSFNISFHLQIHFVGNAKGQYVFIKHFSDSYICQPNYCPGLFRFPFLVGKDLSRILCKLKPDMPGHPLAEKNRQLI